MNKIIKQIRKIIGKEQILKIGIFSDDEIVFDIYEVEVPVVVNLESNTVQVECETYNGGFTVDMLYDLYRIVELIEGNIDSIRRTIINE